MAHSTPAFDLPAYAARVIDVLEAAGHEAWVVGGWVRDALRGLPGHDVDVTTSATWQETATTLRSAGIEVHETGTAHGTVTAVVEGLPVETTTYRVDGVYTDRRHPDEVRFVCDVREDLARRDFTINAMAYHPERGLLDPYGGQADLETGVIRAVGEPRRRFEEDALRVLRAVRFACRMGFVVEPITEEALRACAGELAYVAAERIGQELAGIIGSGRVAWALMHETEVMVAAIPELGHMVGFDQRSPWHAYDVLEHTVRVCRAVEEFSAGCASPELRWAALLHDVAKPATFTTDETGRGHFYGHPAAGARMARQVLRRLALPTPLVRDVCALIAEHDHPVASTARSMRRVLRDLEAESPGRAVPLAFELLDLKRADAVSKARGCSSYAVELDAVEAALRSELAAGVALTVRDLAVSGRDVMEVAGIAPGPEVGEVLDALLSSVTSGDVSNERETLLARLRPVR